MYDWETAIAKRALSRNPCAASSNLCIIIRKLPRQGLVSCRFAHPPSRIGSLGSRCLSELCPYAKQVTTGTEHPHCCLFVRSYGRVPSIESNEKLGLNFQINGGQSLNRRLWLVKWLLAIPLYIVGSVYIIYALMLSIVAWITVVFTGTYPEWCIYGVIGTIAFWNRVYGYAVVLVTDEYPTFSL